MFEHNKNAIFGFADFTGGKMRGGFQPGERENIRNGSRLFNDFDDLGSGTWTAEKKSDDPNFDFPVYQYCSIEHGNEAYGSHFCPKVSDETARGVVVALLAGVAEVSPFYPMRSAHSSRRGSAGIESI